jgi:urease accessory protein
MDEVERFLAALQHGDSAFPGGGFAFSWGIEGLVADELVGTVDDLERVVEDLLLERWATFDRLVLRRAFAAGFDLDRVSALDREVEAGTLVAGLREGSRRAGRALLGVHARLATPGAAAYRAMIDDGAPGHLAVVQGLVWRGLGLSVESAEALAAWGLVWALVSAAIRLDVIGHVAAQASLTRLRRRIAALLAALPPVAPLHAFTPLADIAVARHARRDVRLFAN